MPGLYDKIRKSKKKNLEQEYLNSVAKFKNVNSQSAYGGGEALADPAAAVEGGQKIKESSEPEKKCIDGKNPNTGEDCTDPIKDVTESRDDINQDLGDEEGGGLFGKVKGGSKVGNFLRGIVGKKSYELMDAAPFKQTDPPSGTVSINNELYDLDYDESTDGTGDTCPPGYTMNADLQCVQDSPEADEEKDNAFKSKCYNEDGSRKRGVPGCSWADENIADSIPGDDGDDSNLDLDPRKKKEEKPGETSNNMAFGSQLLNNWGQNLLEGRQERRDKKDIKNDKRSFTKNEQKLFNEARKSLRKAGNLPGRGDGSARTEAIYNEMNRLNTLDKDGQGNVVKEGEDNRNIKRDFGGHGFDVGGGKMNISEIARDIRTGRLSYDSDDIQNLPYEVKEKLRDLSDNQGRSGENQYSDKKIIETPETGTGSLDADIPEAIRNQGKEAIKKYLDEQKKGANNSKMFMPKDGVLKKGFKLGRGKLNRPGY